MERGEIKCMMKHDVRGYHLLDDDGMPYVSMQALRVNAEPTHISVVIDADKNGNERELNDSDYVELRPHVNSALTDLRAIVGDLPLHFQKAQGQRSTVNCDNWLE